MYEMFDVVNCCWNGFYMNWLTLATAVGGILLITSFSPNYFLCLYLGLGEFFEIRIFYPVKLSDLQYSLGEFF